MHLRTANGWRPLSRAAVEQRVRELSNGLLEVGCVPGDVILIEHGTDGEALLMAIAALEIGVTLQLGPAKLPIVAGYVASPARAAAVALKAGLKPICVACSPTADEGQSLERLAAHGVLHNALHRDAVRTHTQDRRGGQRALVTADDTTLSLAHLHAAVRTLRNVGDLLRPGEPVLIAMPVTEPWLVALALAAIEAGAPIAVGTLQDAASLHPGVVVAACDKARGLAEAADTQLTRAGNRYARARSLEMQRGSANSPLRLAKFLRLPGRRAGAVSIRSLIVPDGVVPRPLCTNLHMIGTTVLHAAVDSNVAAPVLLNRPHRYRFDALGLALPDHRCTIIEGRVVVEGPATCDAPDGPTMTSILARFGPDSFIFPLRR